MQTHPLLLKDDADTPEEAIRKIRYYTHEHLYLFKNGKQIGRFRGETDRVTIETKHFDLLEDATLVHNHPRGYPPSREDVEGAIRYNSKELIVVTETYIYIIPRPKNGWNIDFDDPRVEEWYAACENLARSAMDRKIHEILVVIQNV